MVGARKALTAARRGFRARASIAAAAVTALALGLAAAAPAQAADAGAGKKVVFLESIATNPYASALVNAFRSRAESHGMQVTILASGLDAALQAQQVDDAIARKYDYLAIMPLSEQGIVPALLRAKQAGLPVIIVNNTPRKGTEALYRSFIGQDQDLMGRLAGQSALAALKASGRDGGRIALITGALSEGIAPRRLAGFREALKANPKAQIVAVEDAHWDTATSERVAGQLYARFAATGGLDLLYGMADNQAVAAIKAATAAGIPVGMGPKQLIVTGGNCLKQGLAAIQAGQQYSTLTQSPTDVGAHAADLIDTALSGKTLPKEELLPIAVITKANVAEYQAACTY